MDGLNLANLRYPMPLVRRKRGRPVASQFIHNFLDWCRDLDHVNPTINFTAAHYKSAWTYVVARCADKVDREYLLTNYAGLGMTIFEQELRLVQEPVQNQQPRTRAQWQADFIANHQGKMSNFEKHGNVEGLRKLQDAYDRPQKKTVRLDSGCKVDVSEQYDPNNFSTLSSDLLNVTYFGQAQTQLPAIQNNEPQKKRRREIKQNENSGDEHVLPKKKKQRSHRKKHKTRGPQPSSHPSNISATAANTIHLPFNRFTGTGNDGSENHDGSLSSTMRRDLAPLEPSLYYPAIKFIYGGMEWEEDGEKLAEAPSLPSFHDGLPPSHDGLPHSHDGLPTSHDEYFRFYTDLPQVETQTEPYVEPHFESHLEPFVEPQIEHQAGVKLDPLSLSHNVHFRFYRPCENQIAQEEPPDRFEYDPMPQNAYSFYTSRHEGKMELIQFGGNLYVRGDMHVQGNVHVGGDVHLGKGSHDHLQVNSNDEDARIGKRQGKDGKPGAYMDGDVVGAAAPELGLENKGRQMLEKMGWMAGTGLGSSTNQGILDPLEAVVKVTKAGLGGVE